MPLQASREVHPWKERQENENWVDWSPSWVFLILEHVKSAVLVSLRSPERIKGVPDGQRQRMRGQKSWSTQPLPYNCIAARALGRARLR